MQNKQKNNTNEIKSPDSIERNEYNKISDKSVDLSNIIQESDRNKDESFFSDTLSNRNLINSQVQANPISKNQNSYEMTLLKPSISVGEKEYLNLVNKRLNSVKEEVEEEDINANITPLNFQNNDIMNDSLKKSNKSKMLLNSLSSPTSKILGHQLSLKYHISPSLAGNSFILKPDIKVQGLNLKEIKYAPKNYDWLFKKDQASMRGLGGIMMLKHMVFLKYNSNLNISILPLLYSIIFVIIDALQAIVSIFSCIVYIMDCYVTPNDYETLHFLHTAELIITILTTLDITRHFLETKDKIAFFFKLHTIIDIIALLPYYISLIAHVDNSLSFLHILQLFKLVRILRLYRLFNDPDLETSDQINKPIFSLEKQFSIFLCTIFAVLFIFSGISYELNAIFGGTYSVANYNSLTKTTEYSSKIADYTFFYAFYFLSQTFMTVGYGDVTPIEASSRILIALFIIAYLLIFLDQLYKLWEVKRKISPYDFDFKGSDHLVIIGYFNENTLQKMLLELYRNEESCTQRDVLVVRTSPPSAEMLILIEKFNNLQKEGLVTYLQCSQFMKDDIITKANIKKAQAILIINDPNLSTNDNEILMLLKIIQSYNTFIRKIIQINDQNIIFSMRQLSNPWNIYFSPNRLKISLLINSIFNKGIITLFNNLITPEKIIPHIKTAVECQWFMEYSASYLQNLFSVPFSKFFYNRTFKHMVKLIYKSKSKYSYVQGVLMIGVKRFRKYDEQSGYILINPQDYIIKEGDHAVIIAKDRESAEFISYFIEEAEKNNTVSNLIEKKENSFYFSDLEGEINLIPHDFETCLADEFAKKDRHEKSFNKLNKTYILLWKSDIASRLKGHVIVFADEKNWERIIEETRKKTEKPICFFVESAPSSKIFEMISKKKQVYIFEGNILNLEHLKNANISEAYHVLIFTQNSEDISYNLDSKAIMLSNILEEFFTVPYTMEISDISELKLLGFRAKKEFSNLGMNFDPHFMAGSVLPSTMFDSLSVYLLEDEILLDFIKNILNMKDEENLHSDNEKNDEFNENKDICSIDCPPSFYGKNYGDFLLKCISCSESIIPLGILTKKFTKIDSKKSKVGLNINDQKFFAISPTSPHKKISHFYEDDKDPRVLKLPIFLLNPLPTTILSRDDILIVLGDIKKGKKITDHSKAELFSVSIEEEIFRKEGVKDRNIARFQEIVENLKTKLLNQDALEELCQQKNEMIDNLESLIDQQKEFLTKIKLRKKSSQVILEENKTVIEDF